MLQKSRELIFAMVAIVFITILYLFMVAVNRASPAASGLYGHSMGILGFTLMLLTETLYPLRKQMKTARWGRMSSWLEFHIFTGLVGPYLVLLHTSWQFHGLAGVLSLLTLMIVISGFIGRYIYTAVPRTADGIELSLAEMGEQIRQLEDSLAEKRSRMKVSLAAPSRAVPLLGPAGLKLSFLNLNVHQSSLPPRRASAVLNPVERAQAGELKKIVRQRDRLKRQAASLNSARRMLSIWHAVHIPLGLTLFAMAIVHIVGAVYFAGMIK